MKAPAMGCLPWVIFTTVWWLKCDILSLRLTLFNPVRPDLKICWFALTRLGLQETCGSKKVFSHKCIILALATLTLEDKVNFLF